MVAVTENLIREQVEHQVEGWIRRLNALYAQVDVWRGGHFPDSKPAFGLAKQHLEEPLQRFRIAPRMLPTYSIELDATCLSFKPMWLWMIGADGQVDVFATSPERVYISADTSTPRGEKAGWHVPNKDDERLQLPFTREVFQAKIANQL